MLGRVGVARAVGDIERAQQVRPRVVRCGPALRWLALRLSMRPMTREPSMSEGAVDAVPAVDPVADPSRAGFGGRVTLGVREVLAGQRLAFAEPTLRRRALWLVAINLMVYILPLWFGQALIESWEHDLAAAAASRDGSTPWLLALAVDGVIYLLDALWFVVSFFFSLIVGRIFIAAMVDRFTASVETLFFARPEPQFPLTASLFGAVKEIGVESSLLVAQLPVLLGLWLLSLVPLIGVPLALGLGYIWTCMWLALATMAPVISRHGHGTWRRLRLLGGNKALCLGLGAVPAVLPVLLYPLFLPGLTVGATRIFLGLASHDRVDSDLGVDDKARLGGRRA